MIQDAVIVFCIICVIGTHIKLWFHDVRIDYLEKMLPHLWNPDYDPRQPTDKRGRQIRTAPTENQDTSTTV